MPKQPISNLNDVTQRLANAGLEGVQVSVGPASSDNVESDFKSIAGQKDAAHLVELSDDLHAITSTTEKRKELIERYLDAVTSRGRMISVAWVEIEMGSQPRVVESRFKNPSMDSPAMRQQLVDAASISGQGSSLQIFRSEKVRGSLVVCAPFFKDEQTTAVMCGMVHDDKAKSAEAMMVCQSVADHYNLWRSRDRLTSMAMEVRSTATVLELVGKTECSITVKDACVKIANELQSLFRCDYVAVGLKQSKIASCKLMAISSMAEFDHQSRTTTQLRSAFDEAILKGRYTSFPAPPADQSGPALSHKKLAQQMRCEAAITIPLRNQNEVIVGAVSILGNRQLDRNPATRNLINALEHPLGSCIEVVRLAEGGWMRKLQRRIISSERTSTKMAVIAAVLITAIAMLVPVPYRINSTCTAEPVIRSFSVAPHDGLLESTFVEPGDVVTKGQLLARMEGRELRSQISAAVAKKNRAAKEHDAFLANGKIADSIQSNLDHLNFDAELKILHYKEEKLEIKSQFDGIVLSGSIDKRENFPVTVGQKLYEIAPITPLRIELAIPADEIMHVENGQEVKFRFDGFGTKTIVGVVDRIRPSSMIRDEENVFIAEAILENKDGKVRPGMNGHARVYGKKRSLGWAIFHRPWEKIVTAIGF
jgi:hypothetical protein